jgi:competence protein ComGC
MATLKLRRLTATSLASTLALFIATAGFAEAPPKALLKISGLAPGRVTGALYVRADTSFQDWIFGLLPFGSNYREVLEERGELFEQRTGINPMRDVRGLAVVSSQEKLSPTTHRLFFLDLAKDPRKLAKALAADAKLKNILHFSSSYKGSWGGNSFRFVSGGVVFGPTETMSKLRGKKDRGSTQLAKTAAAGVTAPFRVLGGWSTSMLLGNSSRKRPLSSPPASMAEALGQVQTVFLGMDSGALSIQTVCRTPEVAEFLRREVATGIKKSLKSLQEEKKDTSKGEPGLGELLALEGIAKEVSRRWSKRFVAGLSIRADGKKVSLISRGKLMESPWSFLSVPLVGALAAVAVPNFRAARLRANQRACFANQKTLAGATEMYNLDNNTDVKELTPKFLKQLQQGGYMMSIPSDPGQGKGSRENYYLVHGGNDYIACKVHGSISGETPGSQPAPPPAAKGSAGPGIPMIGTILKGIMALGPSRGVSQRPGFGGGFQHASEKANRRACFANQKTIAGATEMYNLDYNTNVTKIDKAFLDKLKNDGYLQSVPDDPGEGAGSWSHYYSTEKSQNGIACTVHGNVQGNVPGK